MNTQCFRRIPGVIALGMLLVTSLAIAGCAETLVPRAAPSFRVQSEITKNRRGATRVIGDLYNDYGSAADHIELLVEALDERGQVVAKRVVPFLGSVPPLGRTFFDVPAPAAAASYRVSVYWFEWFARGM